MHPQQLYQTRCLKSKSCMCEIDGVFALAWPFIQPDTDLTAYKQTINAFTDVYCINI